MRRLFLSILIVMASAPLALAQSSTDSNRLEVYGGYSLGRVESNTRGQNVLISGDGTLQLADMCSSSSTEALGQNFQKFYCTRRSFNGFDTSVAYNLSKYFGIKADVTGHFKSDQFVDTSEGVTVTVSTRERLYNFLGGLQVKNNSKTARFKPFAHALIGAAHYTSRIQQTAPVAVFALTLEDKATSFAMKIGGGLDVRVNRHVDVRLIELDYNPMFAGDRALRTLQGPFTVSSTGKTANNFTVGFGIVIH
ncbi:MAG: outer membrane beta-barrel protein [Acidobacteriota bacterium]|nr:outer membrane beta-barrel protein [Acidobacteriota bacterium]